MNDQELYDEISGLSDSDLLTFAQTCGPFTDRQTFIIETIVLNRFNSPQSMLTEEDLDRIFNEVPLDVRGG